MPLLPFCLLLAASFWHFASYYHYKADIPAFNVLLAMATAMVFAAVALFYRAAKGSVAKYLESLLEPLRGKLIGISCAVLGLVHFLGLLGQEPIYIQMAYLVLLLGAFEYSSQAIEFYHHYSNGMIEATRSTLHRYMAGQAGKLGMVFALSSIMLYLGLMVILGFTGPFSVAFFAAVMILAIALITLVRRL